MKILIVDDEPLARSRLKMLINDLGVGEVIGEASNGKHALELCKEVMPDTVLLDIRMPGMDGIEAASHLSKFENPPSVVFTTAYDEYALQAFDVSAVDYLLKPVRKERLLDALNRGQHLTAAQSAAIEKASGKKPQHISVRVQDGVRLIYIRDIYYFIAEHKYVSVFYTDGEVIVEESLKALEEKLSDSFIRIHRNALVAAHQISALERERGGGYRLVLKDVDTKLDVSRRHLSSVREFMKNLSTMK